MRVTDPEQKERFAQLEAKIEAAKLAQAPKPRVDEHYSAANLAWRMVIELVAGLLIGFGIGYGLDWLFGTLPLFLILFILLGFAAGVKTVLRTAQEAQEENIAQMGVDDEKDGKRGN